MMDNTMESNTPLSGGKGHSSAACRCGQDSIQDRPSGFSRPVQIWSGLCRSWKLHRNMLTIVILLVHLHTSWAALEAPSFQPTDIRNFTDGRTSYYRYLAVDSSRYHLYVGAMEYIYRLDIRPSSSSVFNFIPSINLTNDIIGDNKKKCIEKKKSADFDCKNHIRAIVRKDDEVYVCGTGAYEPIDTILNLDLTLKEWGRARSGSGKCPLDPNDNSTLIYITEGNPNNLPGTYSGTVMDLAKSNPIIFRPQLSSDVKLIRTVPQDSKWLNEPHFVGSFDIGDYVYFFFRESAVEFMNCGKAIYSRVARVCKKDQGSESSVLSQKWTTYLKARLNCSIPGEYPFYFDELYDVYRDEDTFYGVFSTNLNGLHGSAVCAFDNAEIEKAFQGDFKEQENSNAIWQRVPGFRVPEPRPGECSNNSQSIPDNILQFIKARPLMDQAVATNYGGPLFYQPECVFTKIAVDTVIGLDNNEYKVFFLASTKDGEVHKVVEWHDETAKSRVLAVWKPFGENSLPLQQMKFFNKRLYVSTDNAVVEVPVEQCGGYTKCTQCVRDPYCGWDDDNGDCRSISQNRWGLVQNVRSESPVQTCSSACSGDPQTEIVHVTGNSIHLHCQSKCEATNSVEWRHQNVKVKVDHTKFFITQDHGLIILNVTGTDNGTYECQTENIKLVSHYLFITHDCHGKEEECWRNEFEKWCKTYDEYQEQYNQWTCVKNKCIDGEKDCNMPEGLQQQCLKKD